MITSQTITIWILSIGLIILSSICDAIVDTLNHHYHKSIFRTGNYNHQMWWNPENSWRNKYYPNTLERKVWFTIFGIKVRTLVQISDAFHLFKTIRIITGISGSYLLGTLYSPDTISFLFNISLVGVVWNVVFNTFYNHLLLEKDERISKFQDTNP